MEKRTKELARHPIRYFSEYLASLFREQGEQGEQGLIQHVTLSTKEGIFKVTCHDDETYHKLKRYESLVSLEFVKNCGMKGFLFQYDVYYAVFKVIRDFEKEGIKDFTVEQVSNEVNKLPPQRTETRIKTVLQQFSRDLSSRWHYSEDLPEWLLKLRGTAPIVEKVGQNVFRLVPKPEPKPKKEKKVGKKQ